MGICPLLDVLELVPCTSVLFDRIFLSVILPSLGSGCESKEGNCIFNESVLDNFTAWPKLFSSILQRRLAEDRWKVKDEAQKLLLQVKVLTAFWHRNLHRLDDTVVSDICKLFKNVKSKMRGVFGELVLRIIDLLDKALESVLDDGGP